MSRSTGPVLAAGAITLGNSVLLSDRPIEFTPAVRIVVATGIAAGLTSLIEKAFPDAAVTFAYLALITIVLTRVDPKTPSPAERLLSWWNAPTK